MVREPRDDAVRGDADRALFGRLTRLRYVRCEECGAKALVAASRCPACGNAFRLRNSMGDPVPLARCPNCDLYYPRTEGDCRWCGSKPASFPIAPVAWGTFVVLVLVGLGVTAWHYRTTTVAQAPAEIVLPAADTSTDTSTFVVPAFADSIVAVAGALADTTSRADSGNVAAALDSARPSPVRADSVTVAVAAGSVRGDSARPVVSPPAVSKPAAKPVASARPKSPLPARKWRWVSATVRGWVRVKSAATHESRTIAMIGPDTRVLVGESREGWLRVRLAGASGWALQEQLLQNSTLRR